MSEYFGAEHANGVCPDDEDMELLATGKLDPGSAAFMGMHVEGCQNCRERLSTEITNQAFLAMLKRSSL
jgi:anti-sigma factor ChrR (cupin superfamily)